MPPRWALGYHQCRFSYDSETRVRQIADTFRIKKIPCDVVWMDIDYMEGYRVFTFNKDRFSNPKALNDYLHQKGFKSVYMIDPGVKVDPNYGVYQSGSAKNIWVRKANGDEYHGKVWPGDCTFPDFTQPEARKWWSGLYKDFLAKGIDGVWNDMIIAGPCSAETEEQVMSTAKQLSEKGIKMFRAGIWKPRTKPGGFEGVGVDGLPWLKEVKKETGMYISTEVATAKHVLRFHYYHHSERI